MTVTMQKPVFLAVIVAGALGLSGCRPAESAAPPPPPEVTVALPVQKDVVDYAYFTGRTEASDFVEIRARVKGFLETVNIPKKAAVGDIWTFDKGEVLFRIDPKPFEARLAAAQARFEQTKAKLALTEANLRRAEQLVAKRAIPQEEYQTRWAQREAAVAELRADQAAIDQARIDLGYTVMRSPFRGRVSRSLVDPGNLVGASENTLLATIVRMDPMYVYFDVSEKVILQYLEWKRQHEDLQERPKVYLGLADEQGYPHEGVLDYLENQVDPTTGTAIIRGVFPNKQGYLYPGLFVRVRVPLEPEKDAVLIRERALGTDLGGKYVLVVKGDDVVEQRYVELGSLTDGMRVIRKGLAPGERYIVDGLQRARPGLPVTPKMTAGQTPPAKSEAGDQNGLEPPSATPAGQSTAN